MKLTQLFEGSWAIPQSVEQAQQLVHLMSQPLPANKAEHLIYNIIGDDKLFDSIDEVIKKDDPNDDVRHLVISRIEEFLKYDPSTFRHKWDPQAREMLTTLVTNFWNKFYEQNRVKQ